MFKIGKSNLMHYFYAKLQKFKDNGNMNDTGLFAKTLFCIFRYNQMPAILKAILNISKRSGITRLNYKIQYRKNKNKTTLNISPMPNMHSAGLKLYF